MFRKTVTILGLTALLLVFMLAVSGSVVAQDSLPALSSLKAGEWNEIAPGGDTMCAYGTPFRFFVRPAAEPTDKVMVFFAGGGACWNADNCAPSYKGPDDNPIFMSAVPEGSSAFLTEGVFNYDNPENPVADYNAVYIPTCTADIHTGNAVYEYESSSGEKYTMYHKGFVNAQSALNWTYENFPQPSDVFLPGCSAGSYGSIAHAPYVMEQYADAHVVQIGDAGIGVTPRGWAGFESWGTLDNLAPIEGLKDVELAKFRTNLLYRSSAAAFPQNEFAQMTAYLDTVQIFFYFLQGGGATPEEAGGNWVAGMRSNLGGLDANVSNFRSFMYGGSQHCILPFDLMYNYAADGVTAAQWVSNLLADEPAESASCGDNTTCGVPEEIND